MALIPVFKSKFPSYQRIVFWFLSVSDCVLSTCILYVYLGDFTFSHFNAYTDCSVVLEKSVNRQGT